VRLAMTVAVGAACAIVALRMRGGTWRYNAL